MDAMDMSVATIGAVDYSNALKGLSLQQAQLLLTTQGMDVEQQKQLLLQAGLIASTDKMSASLVKQSLSNSALSKTEQERVLINTGLMNAKTKELILTNSCTEAKLREKLVAIGCIGTAQDEIVARILGNSVRGAETISWDVLTASIWENIKAMWTWLTTNPAGWATLAIGGITALTAVILSNTDSMEEAKEKTTEAYNELQSISSEVESLTGKIEELQNQIDGLDPITNEEDIKNLETEKGLLEAELAILKEKERLANQEANDSAEESLGRTFASKYVTENEPVQIQMVAGEAITTGGVKPVFVTEAEELELAMEKYRELQDDKNNLLAELKEIEKTEGKDSNAYLEKAKELENLKTQIEPIEKDMVSLADSIQTQNKALNDGELKQSNNTLLQTYSDLITETNNYTDALNENSDAKQENANKTGILSFEEQISQVQSLSKGLDQLADIYKDVKDKGEFDYSSILNNTDFTDTFGKYTDEYNKFIETITNSPKDINACQDAFNELASAYIYNQDALKNVTEETKDATIQLLEQMGVENADDVVTTALANKKAKLAAEEEYLALTSKTVAEITHEEVNELIEEGKIAGYTAQYLAQLAWKKIDFNNLKINSQDDVNQILAIAEAAGTSSVYVNALKKALNNLVDEANGLAPQATLKAGGKVGIATKDEKFSAQAFKDSFSVNDIVADITDELTKIDLKSSFGDLNFGGNIDIDSSSASSSAKSTTETYDHIETKLETITKKTEKLGKAFEKTFTVKGTEKKFKQYLSQIDAEVEANNTAISTYQQKLNSIGLSSDWINKIKSGDYSIEDVTDETLKAQIKEYQTWYDKKVACEEHIISLEEERAQAQATYAEKITEYYDKEIEKIEKLISKRERLISLKETFGGSASAKDLQYQMDKNTDMIDEFNEQNEALLKLRDQQKKGSEAWNTYNEQIKENKESIRDLTQENAELAVEMANLPIDKYEKYLEKNQKKSDLYDAKADNTTSATGRNKYINKQIKILDKNNDKAQETAKQTAKNINTEIGDIKSAKSADKKGRTKAEKAEINELYKKIQSYTKKKKQIPASIIQKLSEKGYSNLLEQCTQYNAAILANETAQETAKISAEETEAQKRALEKEKFDNIQTDYDRKQDDIDHKTNTTNSKMQLAQAKGYLDSGKWYDMLIGHEKEKQASLKEERAKLVTQLANIKYGTDEWWDAQDAIQAVDEEIANSNVTLQEYINTQRQIEFDNFEYMIGQISRLTSEAEFLMDMMQNKEMTNDDGGLSDYGIASLGLYVQNLDTYKKQAQAYGAEIQRIREMLADYPYNTELIAQLQEYEDAQRDVLTATEAQKKAIVDLAKQGYQALVDSLSEVADKYKEMLRSAKDANDYQNTIADKTEEADNLRKKIIAYESMSGNEEIAAKIQKTQKELKDIEKDIQETMYERYISDTENALDELLYELETYINELDFDKIFNDAMNTVNGNTDTIAQILNGIASENGIKVSSDMSSVWANGYTPEKGFASVNERLDTLISISNGQATGIGNVTITKASGFATGGIAKLVKPKGEDGLGWMRNGEGLIAPENVQDIRNLMDVVPNMTKFINTTPKFDVPVRNVGMSENITIEIGDINMHGINDMETFGRQLREEIISNGKSLKCLAEAVSAQQNNNGIGSARRYL